MIGGPVTEAASVVGALIGAGAAVGSVLGLGFVAAAHGIRTPREQYLEAAALVALICSVLLPAIALLEEIAGV